MTFPFFSASAHYQQIHNSKLPTFYTKNDLLGQYAHASGTKTHYLNELVNISLASTVQTVCKLRHVLKEISQVSLKNIFIICTKPKQKTSMHSYF